MSTIWVVLFAPYEGKPFIHKAFTTEKTARDWVHDFIPHGVQNLYEIYGVVIEPDDRNDTPGITHEQFDAAQSAMLTGASRNQGQGGGPRS